MRQVLNYFWNPELLLICHDLPNVKIRNAYIQIVSDLREEGLGSCVLV